MSEPFKFLTLDPDKKFLPELFPPEIIALNQEVAHHPNLRKILKEQEVRDIYILLLEVATYCDVLMVAEVWTRQELLDLCTKLTGLLYQKRTQIIVPLA
jgi:hypothetical protein